MGKKVKESKDDKREKESKDDKSEKETTDDGAEEKPRVKKSKKAKASKSDGILGQLPFLLVIGAVGYCRYNAIKIPILDDLVHKVLSAGGVSGGFGGGGGTRDDGASTLANARAGKPMAVPELLLQMNQFCGRSGACTSDYWDSLPDVASALKSGPGTWDRKPMKKAAAHDIDEVLAKVAGRPEARTKATWDALRIICKELFDVTPKSMKESLASRIVLKSATPPDGAKAPEPEQEQEEQFPVDDL